MSKQKKNSDKKLAKILVITALLNAIPSGLYYIKNNAIHSAMKALKFEKIYEEELRRIMTAVPSDRCGISPYSCRKT